jgi:hypothetical protein
MILASIASSFSPSLAGIGGRRAAGGAWLGSRRLLGLGLGRLAGQRRAVAEAGLPVHAALGLGDVGQLVGQQRLALGGRRRQVGDPLIRIMPVLPMVQRLGAVRLVISWANSPV